MTANNHQYLITGGEDPFRPKLINDINSAKRIDITVSFIRQSGLRLILDALIDALHAQDFEIAMESNGTLTAHPGIDWLCISPKAGSKLVQTAGDELKLVWPQAGSDVDAMEGWDFANHLVQPLDNADWAANQQACVDFVMARPKWRLSLQNHKALGLR